MRPLGALVALLVALGASAGGSGCAVLGKEGRPIARALDDNVAPESTAAKAVLLPIGLPVGLVALAVDGLVVNPVRFLPDALDDAMWVFDDVPFTGPGEVLVFPMRLVTFPLILIGSEVVRCSVPESLE